MFLVYLAFYSPETFLPFAENKPSVFWWDGAVATLLSEVGEKGFFKLFCSSYCPEPRPPRAPAAARSPCRLPGDVPGSAGWIPRRPTFQLPNGAPHSLPLRF